MIANIIASVPAILFHFHKEGSVSAIILAIIVGTILITMYTRFFNSFPGMTLPELLKNTTSKWFYKSFVFFLAIVWFVAGLITLVTFTFLLIRFLTPEMPIIQICLTIMIPALFGSLMKTERILYTLEILILIGFPIIVFVFYKAYSSDKLEWAFVKDAALYFNQLPNLHSFSACFYLFLGVANLFIFNRFFTEKQNFNWKNVLFIGLLSSLALFTTYFIPIGFNGLDHIEELVYPWISTSDSLRMDFFLIERVLFVFLILYVGIAYLSIMIHWHVSLEFINSIFNLEKVKFKGIAIGKLIVILLYVGVSLFFVRKLNEYQLFLFTSLFYDMLIIFFPSMLLLFFFIKRGMKNVKKAK